MLNQTIRFNPTATDSEKQHHLQQKFLLLFWLRHTPQKSTMIITPYKILSIILLPLKDPSSIKLEWFVQMRK